MKPGNRLKRYGANSCRDTWQMRGRTDPSYCEGFLYYNNNYWDQEM